MSSLNARCPDVSDPKECYAPEPEGVEVEDVGVSLADGVVFVDTRDLPPPEAVLPVTPMKDSSLQQQRPPYNSSSSANADTRESSVSVPVSRVKTLFSVQPHCCMMLVFFSPNCVCLRT